MRFCVVQETMKRKRERKRQGIDRGLTVLRSISKSLKLLFYPSLCTLGMNLDITIMHFVVLIIIIIIIIIVSDFRYVSPDCRILIRVKQGLMMTACTSCQQGW